jgi:hypothetical protein
LIQALSRRKPFDVIENKVSRSFRVGAGVAVLCVDWPYCQVASYIL